MSSFATKLDKNKNIFFLKTGVQCLCIWQQCLISMIFSPFILGPHAPTPPKTRPPPQIQREFRRGTFVDFRYYETHAESNRLSESRPNTALKLKTFLMLLGEINGINRVGNVLAKTDQTYYHAYIRLTDKGRAMKEHK